MRTSLHLFLSMLRPARIAMLAATLLCWLLMATAGNAQLSGIPLPATAEANDQKPGSILFFNYVTSSVTNPQEENTELIFTNVAPSFDTPPRPQVTLRVFFVDGTTGASFSQFVTLIWTQTITLLASDLAPGRTGYVVAVAVDPVTLCPIKFNHVIGLAHIKKATGHRAGLPAVAISAIADPPVVCGSTTGMLKFDGVAYNRVARSLTLDNVPARPDGNDTFLILNRVGGDLTVGGNAATLPNLFGLFYDDAENVLSFVISGGAQIARSLGVGFPRLTPRYELFIPSGRSGWMRIYSFPAIPEQGLLGAAINFNPNTDTGVNAFLTGHNLTHRTLTAAASYTIPLTAPDLALSMTHSGGFVIGGTGNYVLTVTNTSSAMGLKPNNVITVDGTLPRNLRLNGFSGEGWNCTADSSFRVFVSCTTNAVLGAGESAPPLTLTVNVEPETPSGVNSITFTAGVNAHEQENNFSNNVASDPTTINCPAISVGPATIPSATQGLPYSAAFTQTGATAPLTWSISAGVLPSGLTLNATTGVLSGAPLLSGDFNFTVQVKDVSNCMATQSYTLFVAESCARIQISPASLGGSFTGATYSQLLTAAGGAAPHTFTVGAGTLPTGLTLSTGGILSGTVTSVGVFDFTVVATDANNCIGGRRYRVVVSSSDGLMFYPLPRPIRLLDTRAGQTGCDAPGAPIPGDTSRLQNARLTCGGVTIPAEAAAITGHITTVNSGGGYLTLFPGDITDPNRPLAANVNYLPNEIVNNAFTVRLGTNGAFKIRPTTTTDVVVDVTGYYAPPGAGGLYFHPLPKPVRLLDTRPGQNACISAPRLSPIIFYNLKVPGTCSGVTIPDSAKAVVGNATVLNSNAGYLTIFPSYTEQPLASNSNFAAGQVVNAAFTAELNPTGLITLAPSVVTDLVMDIVGYYSPVAEDENGVGLLFNPLPNPARILETRPGFFNVCGGFSGQPIQGGAESDLSVYPCAAAGISNKARAIVGNATVVSPQSDGYLTLWPADAVRPLAATSNFAAGQVLNRHFTVGIDNVLGRFKIFSSATTHLVIDASGFFAP